MMEEWQRRQREEKEKERRQKQASAEILSGYRGAQQSLTEEQSLKLKALREEERRQKAEADQNLHNFKKLEEPGVKARKAREMDPNMPPPVNTGEQEEDNIAFGSISSIKANFNNNPQTASTTTSSPVRSLTKTAGSKSSPQETAASSFDAAPPLTNDNGAYTDGDVAAGPAAGGNGGANNLDALLATGDDDAFFQTMEQSNGDSTAAGAEGGGDYDENINDETTDAAQANPPVATQQQQQQTEAKSSSLQEASAVAVFFKFGIISESASTPNHLEAYMKAIQDIVQETLNENYDASNDDVGVQLSATPTVYTQSVDYDYVDPHQRANIQRVQVTTSVPLWVADPTTTSTAAVRSHVLSAVGQAIQNGQLLEARLRHTN